MAILIAGVVEDTEMRQRLLTVLMRDKSDPVVNLMGKEGCRERE
mgnify:CR=1 FL=1